MSKHDCSGKLWSLQRESGFSGLGEESGLDITAEILAIPAGGISA